MILGENVRPLFMQGKICNNCFSLSKIIKNKSIDDKNDIIQVLTIGNMKEFVEGFSGYIFEDEMIDESICHTLNINNVPYMVNTKLVEELNDSDIIDINNKSGLIHIVYSDKSYDNVLFITNQCNSNCVFCPESEMSRRHNSKPYTQRLNKIIELLPSDCKSLCITGGEPTLIGESLIDIVRKCSDKFEDTDFMMLTNGRAFCNKDYTKRFVFNRPQNMIYGIAIHGHDSELHDFATSSRNSFAQTMQGIKNLYDLGERIEIRIVVNRLNVKKLVNIAILITTNFPEVECVSFMGLEMLGNAAINRDLVWIDFETAAFNMEKAIYKLVTHGIKINIYNFPLCAVNEDYWQFCKKSISDYKVRYYDKCLECSAKDYCGGFFGATMKLGDFVVKPFIRSDQ